MFTRSIQEDIKRKEQPFRKLQEREDYYLGMNVNKHNNINIYDNRDGDYNLDMDYKLEENKNHSEIKIKPDQNHQKENSSIETKQVVIEDNKNGDYQLEENKNEDYKLNGENGLIFEENKENSFNFDDYNIKNEVDVVNINGQRPENKIELTSEGKGTDDFMTAKSHSPIPNLDQGGSSQYTNNGQVSRIPSIIKKNEETSNDEKSGVDDFEDLFGDKKEKLKSNLLKDHEDPLTSNNNYEDPYKNRKKSIAKNPFEKKNTVCKQTHKNPNIFDDIKSNYAVVETDPVNDNGIWK